MRNKLDRKTYLPPLPDSSTLGIRISFGFLVLLNLHSLSTDGVFRLLMRKQAQGSKTECHVPLFIDFFHQKIYIGRAELMGENLMNMDHIMGKFRKIRKQERFPENRVRKFRPKHSSGNSARNRENLTFSHLVHILYHLP